MHAELSTVQLFFNIYLILILQYMAPARVTMFKTVLGRQSVYLIHQGGFSTRHIITVFDIHTNLSSFISQPSYKVPGMIFHNVIKKGRDARRLKSMVSTNFGYLVSSACFFPNTEHSQHPFYSRSRGGSRLTLAICCQLPAVAARGPNSSHLRTACLRGRVGDGEAASPETCCTPETSAPLSAAVILALSLPTVWQEKPGSRGLQPPPWAASALRAGPARGCARGAQTEMGRSPGGGTVHKASGPNHISVGN